MRATMACMAMCLWLVGCGAAAMDRSREMNPGTGDVGPRVFNVLDYGAVGDDKTDNTAAFSACLKAVIGAGGGRMYLPAGVYRGRILIPPVSRPISSWITVEIVGEREPTPVFGTIGSFPLRIPARS